MTLPTTSPSIFRGDAPARPSAGPPEITAAKRQSKLLYRLSSSWLVLVLALAVTASLLPIPSPVEQIGSPRLAPSTESLGMLLGTDTIGRSVLSRLIFGAQVSLLIGTVAAAVGLLAGVLVGLFAGYFRGKFDTVSGLLVETLLAFPPLILLLALSAVLSPSLSTLLLGLSIGSIPAYVRLARSGTIRVSSQGYVLSAVNMGASRARILFKEILPNVVPVLLAYFPIIMAALIVAEGSLSFLGLGMPPPRASWGGAINDGQTLIRTDPLLVLIPATTMFLTVFSLNQVGDHLRSRYEKSS